MRMKEELNIEYWRKKSHLILKFLFNLSLLTESK